MKTYIVLSDIQFPFEDQRVLNRLVLPFVRDLQPDGVVLNGDITDAYDISDFAKNPDIDSDLSVEIEKAQQLMAALSRCAKDRWWIGGNHEDRWRRQIWRNPQLKAMFKDFDAAMRMKDFGFQWQPYGQGIHLGKLYVTHGSRVRKHSGDTARAHFEKYGISVLVGHSHRLGVYYHRNMGGAYAAYENGCLCRLDPEYEQWPDWQQGFSVVQVDKSGLFHVTQVPILRRSILIYGGKEYRIEA